MSVLGPGERRTASSGEVLPFPTAASGSLDGRTMQESTYQPREPVRHVRKDTPNVLIVLIDDAGPAVPSTFGGNVRTATLDRVLGEGIGFNRFHTTAMCSPTLKRMHVAYHSP